jgi:hypothetical protein
MTENELKKEKEREQGRIELLPVSSFTPLSFYSTNV